VILFGVAYSPRDIICPDVSGFGRKLTNDEKMIVIFKKYQLKK
jgi:hypothetical protein